MKYYPPHRLPEASHNLVNFIWWKTGRTQEQQKTDLVRWLNEGKSIKQITDEVGRHFISPDGKRALIFRPIHVYHMLYRWSIQVRQPRA